MIGTLKKSIDRWIIFLYFNRLCPTLMYSVQYIRLDILVSFFIFVYTCDKKVSGNYEDLFGWMQINLCLRKRKSRPTYTHACTKEGERIWCFYWVVCFEPATPNLLISAKSLLPVKSNWTLDINSYFLNIAIGTVLLCKKICALNLTINEMILFCSILKFVESFTRNRIVRKVDHAQPHIWYSNFEIIANFYVILVHVFFDASS